MTVLEKAAIDLAPSGVLRVALNLGNPLLVQQASSGVLSGLVVDLAAELARQLHLPLKLLTFPGAGAIVKAVSADAWDVAFLASDALRASELLFTKPYITLSGSFVVRSASSFQSNDEVDQEGVHIVVGQGSAYDLYLSKTIKHANLVRVPTTGEVLPSMVREGYEVAAGVRQHLEEQLLNSPTLRLLDGRFMTILQAAAVPKGRTSGLNLLRDFIETMKASGFVQRGLLKYDVKGVEIAPLASYCTATSDLISPRSSQ